MLGVLSAPGVSAYMFTVTMNTAPLIGHAAGPFSIYFLLTDGSFGGDGNNTVTLSGFNVAGVGGATYNGGASGNLNSSVVLTDTAGFNDFRQQFTVGSTLSFTVDLGNPTMSPGDILNGIPDEFSFQIYDSGYNPLPTTHPSGSFVIVDLVPPVNVQTFASDSGTPPVAGGDPVAINPPAITYSAVPEPSIIMFLALGTVIVAPYWSRKRA
jgi:hypothetical protein